MSGRILRSEEKELVRDLVGQTIHSNVVLGSLDTIKVQDLKDDGMGSVRTEGAETNQKRKAIPVAKAVYLDSDNVKISVQINCDDTGRLYEIDIWKTDFSDTIRYPTRDFKLE